MATEDTTSLNNEEEAQPKKKKKHSIVFRIVSVIVLLGIVILVSEGYYYYRCTQPMSSQSETVEFAVPDGATIASVSEDLQSAGLIRNAKIGYYFAKLNGYSNLYAGKFNLDKSMTLDTIYQTLNDQSAAISDASVTIIEGDWAKDVAAKIAAVTDVSADDLMNLWNNADWIRSEMSKYPFLTEDMFADGVRCYLEGYLAPDTYSFKQDSTAEEITEKILDQTNAVYSQYKDQFAASGYTIHQIYTLASIVQYEGGSQDEEVLKNIASVFYNRLNADMPLQSSVTVCYAIDYDKQTDNWQSCEVNSDFDSPYNTYQHDGLPPGAIENAGTAALEAVLNPNQTDYYYFMADVYGDGTVYFARTLDEHNANVNKYLYGNS